MNEYDQLSWNNFKKNSSNKDITSATPFNRLIAHSKNFFIIAGYGAFTPGYLLIVTKKFIPSYAHLNENEHEELNFILKLLKENNKKKLNRKSAIFEHGMCACIGGLDRAHLHLMTIDKASSEKSLIKSINKSLYERKSGIKYIQFKNYKLENTHDINQFMENNQSNDDSEFKIVGKVLKIKNLKNLDEKKWPKNVKSHVRKGSHYIYFKTDFSKSSYLSTINFTTQFGRQIVYHNESLLNSTFNFKMNLIKKNNEFLEVWKWQNCKFEKNIIDTVNMTKLYLKDFQKKHSKEYKKFSFKIT
jgi:diadenosine tetraphosphate (Ap4A) HIT family hydrolase